MTGPNTEINAAEINGTLRPGTPNAPTVGDHVVVGAAGRTLTSPITVASGQAEADVPEPPAPGSAQKLRGLFVAVVGASCVIAVAGMVESFANVAAFVSARIGHGPKLNAFLSGLYPLTLDLFIATCAAGYVVGARNGRRELGWRLGAWSGIGATVAVNWAAGSWVSVIPAAVAAFLVEMFAHLATRAHQAEQRPDARIPARLWLTAPAESFRLWLQSGRRSPALAAVRREAAQRAAAQVAAAQALGGGRTARRVRAELARQMRAGTLPPAQVLAACGWPDHDRRDLGPQEVLRVALSSAVGLNTAAGNPRDSAADGAVPAPTPAPRAGSRSGPSRGPSAGSSHGSSSRSASGSSGSSRGSSGGSSRGSSGGSSGGSSSGSGRTIQQLRARTIQDLRAELTRAIGDGLLSREASERAIRDRLQVSPARAQELRAWLAIAPPRLTVVPAEPAAAADAAAGAGAAAGQDRDGDSTTVTDPQGAPS